MNRLQVQGNTAHKTRRKVLYRPAWEGWLRRNPGPFGRHDAIGVMQTLAAARDVAQRFIQCFGVARMATRGIAQVFFTNGIADADVHDASPQTGVVATFLMRVVRTNKCFCVALATDATNRVPGGETPFCAMMLAKRGDCP